MTKRRKILLALVGVLILGGVLWAIFPPEPEPEPSYNGKSLSEWIIQYGSINNDRQKNSTAEAAEAIRNIGTNAVPHLVKWIQYRQPTWQGKVNEVAWKYSGRIVFTGHKKRMDEVSQMAPDAFQVFGAKANIAIPELSKILNHPTNMWSAFKAAKALKFIGSDSLPVFVASLTNQAASGRYLVPRYLGEMGTNALPAVPALINCLDDPNAFFRNSVTNALLQIAPKALKRATNN